MSDEDKIKQMLRSNEGENRTLGIMYAWQFLGWGELKCIEYCLDRLFEVDFLKSCGCILFVCEHKASEKMDFKLKNFNIYIQVSKNNCEFGSLSVRPLENPNSDPFVLNNDFTFYFGDDSYLTAKRNLLNYLSYFIFSKNN